MSSLTNYELYRMLSVYQYHSLSSKKYSRILASHVKPSPDMTNNI
jgi:hypothetical protein